MKLVVFGASNHLGQRLQWYASQQGIECVRATRDSVNFIDVDALHSFIAAQQPDFVLNVANLAAAGKSGIPDMVLINSFFPHLLQAVATKLDVKIVHVSTDAVFSGHSKYRLTVESPTDPTNYYGKSRAMGEVLANNVCIVRTSFVGPESSIVKWLKSRTSGTTVEGWLNYKWSGSSIDEVASGILNVVHSWAPGVRHLATFECTTKFDVVNTLISKLSLNLTVQPTYFPYVNRNMVPSSGHILLPLNEAIFNDRTFDNSIAYVQAGTA